jgi:hypothetical protein
VSKPVIIPNWKYQKPTPGGQRGLKRLLKYVSYRESPDHRPVELSERWTDVGLGSSWREVYRRCVDLKGQYILAHHLVISPAPDLMALIPEAQRAELVREVTERMIEAWHEARGLDIPEYSFVLHDRDTDEKGEQQLHTHVFTAGTIENTLGERESYRVGKGQVVAEPWALKRGDNLHHIARQEMEYLLDRSLGLDWRKQREMEVEPLETPIETPPVPSRDIDF